MSFGGGSPPPMMVPPPPMAVAPMTPPTSSKPPKKPSQPSFVSQALQPGPGQAASRSLIGGAGQPLGSAAY